MGYFEHFKQLKVSKSVFVDYIGRRPVRRRPGKARHAGRAGQEAANRSITKPKTVPEVSLSAGEIPLAGALPAGLDRIPWSAKREKGRKEGTKELPSLFE